MRRYLIVLAVVFALMSAAQAQDVVNKASPSTTFVVKFKVKTGKNAEFEKIFAEMRSGVHANEPGNVYYDLHVMESNPQTYVIVEHYIDTAAVANHGKTKHAAKLIASLKDLLDGPPEADRLVFVGTK